MSTATMDTEQQQQQQQNKPCRLCLENITRNEIRSGIDILMNNDVRKLLQEVYEVQISPNDSNSTMMCMPCYQQLLNDYKFRIKLFTRRKTFKLNQTMLVAQLLAFGDTPQSSPQPKADGFVSVREKSTQTAETPTPPDRRSPITTTPVENESEKSNVEQPAETAITATCEKQLVPVVVDCLKEPLYFKALFPLVVSTNPDDPAPLMLICNCCQKTFNSKDKLEQHKPVGCVPSCRYCLSEQTADHSCPSQSEFSAIMQYIVGSQKYVSTYATTNGISESNADESVAEEEVGELPPATTEPSNEPKTKKMKLDANHNGRHSPFLRRASTPYPLKGEKNQTAHEMESESETTSRHVIASCVINLSSSEDEVLRPAQIDHKPASKSRPKSRRKRRFW